MPPVANHDEPQEDIGNNQQDGINIHFFSLWLIVAACASRFSKVRW